MRRATRSVPFDDGLLVLADDDRLFVLDGQAAQIWRANEAGVSPAEIVQALADAYPTHADKIRQDVAALLSQWSAEERRDEAGRSANRSPASPKPVWAGEWRCRFGHLVVEIAVENPQLARLFDRLFAHLPADAGAVSARIEVRDDHDGEGIVYVNGREYARTCCPRNVQRALIQLAWPDNPLCAIIHAGAVVLGDKAACFAGISGSGKTTLIARLVGQGLTYLSDDLTPIGMCGRILPWPMPMSVKLDSWGVLSDQYPTLEDAPAFEVKGTRARALAPATDAWRSGRTHTHLLIFPKFVRDGATRVTRLTRFDALRRLIEAGLVLEAPITEERVTTLLGWLGALRAYSLAYGDVDDAASQVLKLLKDI